MNPICLYPFFESKYRFDFEFSSLQPKLNKQKLSDYIMEAKGWP